MDHDIANHCLGKIMLSSPNTVPYISGLHLQSPTSETMFKDCALQ